MQGVPFLYKFHLMEVTICTWNSQGNPANSKLKNIILNNLLVRCDILLLQECGKLCANLTRHPYIYDEEYINMPQAGAYNIRCSNCIISSINFQILPSCYLQGGTGRYMIGISLNTFGINVYCIHAISGKLGAVDVIPALQTCISPFILGGDMNCTPEQLQAGRENNRSLNIGTNSRSNLLNIVKTGSPTTSTKQEYDYFICSPNIHHINTTKYYLMGGDHYPVYSTFYT